MFSDNEIKDAINEYEEESTEEFFSSIDADATSEGADLDDPERESLLEEFDFFNVKCSHGCGTFSLEEVTVLHADLINGTVEFRCPQCNEIQVGDLLILD
jgi:hypothetical protein